MGKLVYSLLSSAYFVDEHWGYGSPHEGIQVMARIAHKERARGGKKITIPVTWLVSPKSALIERELFTEYHEKHGDVVGYMLTYNGHGMNRHADLLKPERKDDLKKHVTSEIAIIKDALPWAVIRVLGTGYRSNTLVQVMEELGLGGLWGYCPFQIGTDGITDFGVPWGSWYVNPADFKKPQKMMGKVIALEWTMRDLSKAFHQGRAEAYSTDPNDVESDRKCTDTNIKYWEALLARYLGNLDLNEYIFFQQHQEAHEMDTVPVCIPFTRERVEYTSKMLDLFLDHLASKDSVIIADANEAIRIFHDHNKGIQPASCIYWEDIPIQDASPEYKKAVENRPGNAKHVWLSFNEKFHAYVDGFFSQENWLLKEPPWKHSFFYHDAECMLVFDKPNAEPVWICNYTDEEGRKWHDELMLSEETIPAAEVEQALDKEGGETLNFTISVASKKFMPYGIAIWGNDFSKHAIIKGPARGSAKIINDTLLFVRLNLREGENESSIKVGQNT